MNVCVSRHRNIAPPAGQPPIHPRLRCGTSRHRRGCPPSNLARGCPGIDAIINTGYENTSCVDGNYTVQYQYVPAGTYYYPVLMDATATGPYTINVSAVACPAGFCDASADSCDEYIAQVICGTIDNTTLCTDGPAVDYTAQSTDVPQGSSLAITVLNGPNVYADDQVAVWVDWNQNENFADAGEAFILVSADASVTLTIRGK